MNYFIQINLWNEFDNLSYRDLKSVVRAINENLENVAELNNFTWTLEIEEEDGQKLIDFD